MSKNSNKNSFVVCSSSRPFLGGGVNIEIWKNVKSEERDVREGGELGWANLVLLHLQEEEQE